MAHTTQRTIIAAPAERRFATLHVCNTDITHAGVASSYYYGKKITENSGWQKKKKKIAIQISIPNSIISTVQHEKQTCRLTWFPKRNLENNNTLALNVHFRLKTNGTFVKHLIRHLVKYALVHGTNVPSVTLISSPVDASVRLKNNAIFIISYLHLLWYSSWTSLVLF